MSTATEFSKEFYQHSQRFFSERVEYTAVTALLLYWKENDISPERELDAIRELFQTDFGFTSLTFPIPSQRAQLELNREITAFVARCSNRVDTLILVYYAGHGDMDENGDGVWAAKEVEGPTLSWKAVQQLLYYAEGDVLVILDCCSAAFVSKGQKKEGKFEILGASAKGSRTPEPGKSSFTSILIKHIRKSMRKAHLINVRSLHGELLENGQLTETPQYADLARSTPRSIVLQPLRSLEHEGFIKKPSSFLMLKISLADDPTGLRIAEWLKAHPPDGVTAVSVEALVLKARRLQGLVDQTVFPPGSMFGKLSEGTQRELLRTLQDLDTVLQSADNSAQNFLEPDLSVITNSIEEIDQSVNAVCKAIETPMLLDPHFPEGTGQDRDEHRDLAWAVGAEDSLSLRRHLWSISAIADNLNLPRDTLHLPSLTNPAQRSARVKRGTLKEKDVLVESVPYGTWDDGTSQGQKLPSKLEVDPIRDYLGNLDYDGSEQDAGQRSETVSQQASVSEPLAPSRPDGYDLSQPPDDRIVELQFQDTVKKQKAKQKETTLTKSTSVESRMIPQNLSFCVGIEPLSPDYGVHGQPIRYSEPGNWLPPNKTNGLTSGQGPTLLLRWEGGRVITVPANDPIRTTNLDGYVYHTATVFTQHPDTRHLLSVPFNARTRSVCMFGRGWQPIRFNHNRVKGNNAYYSYISHRGAEQRIAARGSPHWMPQLLPDWYDCDPRHATRVQAGLIGELPLLFALAAFSAPPQSLGMLSATMQPGKWISYGFITGRIAERGMVVTVYLDPRNPQWSTPQLLDMLQDGEFGPFYGP